MSDVVFQCPKCDRLCKDQRGLSIHISKCNEGLPYKCNICDKNFCSKISLARHMVNTEVHKTIIAKKQTDLMFNSIQIQHEASIQSIQEEYETKLESIQQECRVKVERIEQESTKRTQVLQNELVNKILNIDKEFETKLYEERQKWLSEYKSEDAQLITSLKKRIEKLIEENKFLRTVVSKVGHVCSIDEYENHDVTQTGQDEEEFKELPCEYVYLIQEREFIDKKRPLYKIGRTTQLPYKRYSAYPKGSREIMVMQVSDCKLAEKVLKDIFNLKFKRDPSIGVEYFEGNIEDMKKEFIYLVDHIKDDILSKTKKTLTIKK
jgi:hypothetical protein